MKRMTLLLTLLIAMATACGGSSKAEKTETEVAEQSMEEAPTETAESAPGKMHMGMHERCPMHVEGTTMALGKAEGGIAMSFTNADNVAEVQKRAKMMAEHHPMAMEHHGTHLPAYSVTAQNTETGAQLIMKPNDPEQLTPLATQVTEAINAQGDSQCPMMVMYNYEPKHGPDSGPASAPAEDGEMEADE